MGYHVQVKWDDGRIGNYNENEEDILNSLSDAIENAKHELAYEKGLKGYEWKVESVAVINEQNGLEVWNSNDAPELQKYSEYSFDEWNTLTKGHHATSEKPSIYFDMDGTLAHWHSDGKGLSYEEMLDPTNHYFRNLEPYEMMVQLAEKLQEKGHDVCIMSSADKGTIKDKWEWIEEHVPFIPKENICFAPIGAEKSDFVKGNAEISILIDDYNKNLESWRGDAIKALNGINSSQLKYDEIDFTKHEKLLEEVKDFGLNEYDELKEVRLYCDSAVNEVASSITMQTELAVIKRVAEDIEKQIYNNNQYFEKIPQNFVCLDGINYNNPEVQKEEDGYSVSVETREKTVENIYNKIRNSDTKEIFEYLQDEMQRHLDRDDKDIENATRCFEKVVEIDKKNTSIKNLADDIEQFIFERSCYNIDLQWTVIGYDQDGFPEVGDKERLATTNNLINSLKGKDTNNLVEFIEDEISSMDKEDESIIKATKILSKIDSIILKNETEKISLSEANHPALKGFSWQEFNDGSGTLKDQNGESIISYDLTTNEIEVDGEWKEFHGGLSELKEYAENIVFKSSATLIAINYTIDEEMKQDHKGLYYSEAGKESCFIYQDNDSYKEIPKEKVRETFENIVEGNGNIEVYEEIDRFLNKENIIDTALKELYGDKLPKEKKKNQVERE